MSGEHAPARAAMAGQPLRLLGAEDVLAAQASGQRDWSHQACCASGEHDPELWWPNSGDDGLAARRACAGCPVLGDCRDHFLGQPTSGWKGQELDRGIWAGLPGWELRCVARGHEDQCRTVIEATPQPQATVEDRDGRGQVAYRGELVPRTPFAVALADSGLTQQQLARAAGVGLTSVKLWALGQRQPRPDKAQALAHVLAQPVDELFPTTIIDLNGGPQTLERAGERAQRGRVISA